MSTASAVKCKCCLLSMVSGGCPSNSQRMCVNDGSCCHGGCKLFSYSSSERQSIAALLDPNIAPNMIDTEIEKAHKKLEGSNKRSILDAVKETVENVVDAVKETVENVVDAVKNTSDNDRNLHN